MKNLLQLILVVMVTWSCSEGENVNKKLSAYFDLDSLLDAQIEILVDDRYSLEKTVSNSEESETQIFQPDSAVWDEEFNMIRDFNLNQSYLVGAYTITREADRVIFEPKEELELPITSFELRYRGEDLMEVVSSFSEFKYIYSNQRDLKLTFRKGMLAKYEITGAQNMVLMEEMRYSISGKVIDE